MSSLKEMLVVLKSEIKTDRVQRNIFNEVSFVTPHASIISGKCELRRHRIPNAQDNPIIVRQT